MTSNINTENNLINLDVDFCRILKLHKPFKEFNPSSVYKLLRKLHVNLWAQHLKGFRVDFSPIKGKDDFVTGGYNPCNERIEVVGYYIEGEEELLLVELIVTIMHEMVHAKQIQRREEPFLIHRSKSQSQAVRYYEHPDEVEAYAQEYALYCNWVNPEAGKHILETYTNCFEPTSKTFKAFQKHFDKWNKIYQKLM